MRFLSQTQVAGCVLVCTVAGSWLAARTAWSAVTNNPTAPQVAAPRVDLHIGTIAAGEGHTTTFVVRNSGNRRLLLRRKSKGCDCVATGEPYIRVEPSGQVCLTVNVIGDASVRQMTVREQYVTNDPTRPILALTVIADVAPTKIPL